MWNGKQMCVWQISQTEDLFLTEEIHISMLIFLKFGLFGFKNLSNIRVLLYSILFRGTKSKNNNPVAITG